MNKLIAYIQISRPSNVLIAFLTIIIAAIVAGSIHPITNVLLASLSAALITVGANVINDYFDIQIDSINKPNRPLPSGRLSTKEALIFFLSVYLGAWILSICINLYMFLIAFSIGILLFFYSYKLKRTILWGNLVVSFATAVAFIYGGLAVYHVEGTVYPAIFAFLYHFGREVIKDLQDVTGDLKEGALTFAVTYGIKRSLQLTSAIFMVLIIMTIIPYISGVYGQIYMLIVVIGIYPVLIFVLYCSWKYPIPKKLGLMSDILKADMLVGLIAIYFG